MRVLVGRALPRADHAVQTLSPGELCRMLTQTPNLLSAIRFLLAAVWIAAFMAGHRSLGVLCPIAIVGAISDFVDGRVARWMHRADGFGQWLDGVRGYRLCGYSSLMRGGGRGNSVLCTDADRNFIWPIYD